MADPRSAPVHWVLITCSMAILAGGCRSTGPLLKSEHFDFVTTGLFSELCKDSEAIKQARREERRARRGYESNAAAGECNLPDLDAMDSGGRRCAWHPRGHDRRGERARLHHLLRLQASYPPAEH